ncbi:MAG: hypothetical protein JXR73_07365, partial [Candidatus Omnitrophica bacterium]|nr:hypothetical protein [Candidatus Omnitrophota bacterium]
MKDEILAALQDKDVNRIRELASKKKSILTKLLARTYDHDEEIRWQAVESIAAASSIWARKDLPFVQNFCRRLVWMLNDESGNMGWFAPQVLGAILAENPEALSEFIPLLLSVLDQKNETPITAGALWAA